VDWAVALAATRLAACRGLAAAAALAVCATLLLWRVPALGGAPLRFTVTDLVGREELVRDFGPFARELGDLLDREVVLVPVRSRTDAVGLMRAKAVDLAITGPAEYVVLRKLTDAGPVAGLHRVDYFTVIATRRDSGIADVRGLAGRKVALGSVGSTSAHLAPMGLMAALGLDPLRDVRLVHTTLAKAWRALVRGDVDAACMSDTHFHELLAAAAQGPDPAGAGPTSVSGAGKIAADWPPCGAKDMRVLARGPDLPGDVLVAAPHVNGGVVSEVRRAFLDHAAELKGALLRGEGNGKYRDVCFVPWVSDAEYDPIRAMYATIGFPAYSHFLGD
jgi:phosphonate transport system substrate-binding protein